MSSYHHGKMLAAFLIVRNTDDKTVCLEGFLIWKSNWSLWKVLGRGGGVPPFYLAISALKNCKFFKYLF